MRTIVSTLQDVLFVSNDEAGSLPPWPSDLLIRIPLHVWCMRPWVVALLAFCTYWGSAAVVTGFEGTFLPHSTLGSDRRPTLTDSRSDRVPPPLADSGPETNVRFLSYSSDTTHFLFALNASIGGAFATIILRRFRTLISLLRASGVLAAEPDRYTVLYERHRRIANHPLSKFFAVVLAILAVLAALPLVSDSSFEYWWGHSIHGYAGFLIIFIGSCLVYYAVRGFTLISAGSVMVSRILFEPFRLRPFHPDGCNGVAPLGILTMFLWAFSLNIAIAIFILLHFGYFDLERRWELWIVTAIGTITIPAIAVIPLVRSVKAIHRARRYRIALLEPRLMTLMKVAEDVARNDARVGQLENSNVSDLKTIYDILKSMNVWPFNPRAIAAITIAYIAQVILTTYQLLSLLK